MVFTFIIMKRHHCERHLSIELDGGLCRTDMHCRKEFQGTEWGMTFKSTILHTHTLGNVKILLPGGFVAFTDAVFIASKCQCIATLCIVYHFTSSWNFKRYGPLIEVFSLKHLVYYNVYNFFRQKVKLQGKSHCVCIA